MTDIQKIFTFTTYIGKFKKMERFVGQFFWRDYPKIDRYDSNADHTWRMAMLLTIIEPHLSQPIDFKKAMQMLLIHDIPEIIAGDASPLGSDGTGNDSHAYSDEASKIKYEAEKAASLEIFGMLPETQAKELHNLWFEFEAQSCFEAKVVKAIDKFEGKLQASEYRNGSWFIPGRLHTERNHLLSIQFYKNLWMYFKTTWKRIILNTQLKYLNNIWKSPQK